MYNFPVGNAKGYGRKTENANTVITRLVEPVKNHITRLKSLTYTAGATAHLLTVMRPFGMTFFSADAAASQAVVNIVRDPGAYSSYCTVTPQTANNAIAGSDYVVFEMADGTFVVDTVSSVSSLAITLTTNLGTGGVKKGGRFWFYGTVTNTNPKDALAHPRYTLAASSQTILGGDNPFGFVGSIGGLPGSDMDGTYEPLILQVDNGTNAGVLESVEAVYTQR